MRDADAFVIRTELWAVMYGLEREKRAAAWRGRGSAHVIHLVSASEDGTRNVMTVDEYVEVSGA